MAVFAFGVMRRCGSILGWIRELCRLPECARPETCASYYRPLIESVDCQQLATIIARWVKIDIVGTMPDRDELSCLLQT